MGCMYVTEAYGFTGLGAMYATKPFEFMGLCGNVKKTKQTKHKPQTQTQPSTFFCLPARSPVQFVERLPA